MRQRRTIAVLTLAVALTGAGVGAWAFAGRTAAPTLVAPSSGAGWFAYAPGSGSAYPVEVPLCLDRPGRVRVVRAEPLDPAVRSAALVGDDGRPSSGVDITSVCPPAGADAASRAESLNAGAIHLALTGSAPSTDAFGVRLVYDVDAAEEHLDITLPSVALGGRPG